MTARTWLMIVLVAALNVAMNVALKDAARTNGLALVRSPSFWYALAAGTSSIMLLLLVYRTNVALARALLALGATSVSLSVGAGIVRGERLSRLEFGVLIALVLFCVSAWARRA